MFVLKHFSKTRQLQPLRLNRQSFGGFFAVAEPRGCLVFHESLLSTKQEFKFPQMYCQAVI